MEIRDGFLEEKTPRPNLETMHKISKGEGHSRRQSEQRHENTKHWGVFRGHSALHWLQPEEEEERAGERGQRVQRPRTWGVRTSPECGPS